MPIRSSESSPNDLSEYDYFVSKLPNRTYISKAFPSVVSYDPQEYKKMRFISKVFDSDELHQYVRIKGETVLRITPQQRQEVKALFYEDSRDIESLTIQRFTKETGKPHKTHFTFRGEEIDKLYNLLQFIRYVRLDSEEKEKLDDHILEELLIDAEEKEQYSMQDLDMAQKIVENNITSSDVVALAYRKKQLEIFERLLHDQDFFEATRTEWNKKGKEAVWQKFFEDNPWIFGYGLNYIFTSRLDNKKLEQVTTGYMVNQSGKRVDALLKTTGLIGSLCFVEIKTHKTSLLHKEPYRLGCWRISSELAGSVAQIQKTVQNAILQIHTRMQIYDRDGTPTNEVTFLYQPKAYVVIGSLEQFITTHGTNEQQFGSFELFRRNIVNPEVITFDELFDRAKFIVKHTENEASFVGVEGENCTGTEENSWISEDDIPF